MDDLSPQTQALLDCARQGDDLPIRRRRALRRRVAAAAGVALPLTFGGKIAAGMGVAWWVLRGLAVVGAVGAVAVGVASNDRGVERSPRAMPAASRAVPAAPLAKPPAPVRPSPALDSAQRGARVVLSLAASDPVASAGAGVGAARFPALPHGRIGGPSGGFTRPASLSLEALPAAAPSLPRSNALPPIATAAESAHRPEPPVAGANQTPSEPGGVAVFASVPARDDLAEETRLVASAQRAIENGSAARALSLLEEHDRLFPSGALEPESAALRVDALCAGGRPLDAQAEAARFRARHPGSPLERRPSFRCAEPVGAAPPRPAH